MELVKRAMSEFTGSSTCKNYYMIEDLKVDSEKGTAYERAVAHKDIINEVLSGKAEMSEVNDLVSQGIESSYALDATNQAMLAKETDNLMRYLRNENRKSSKGTNELVDIHYENMGIPCSPDRVFVDEKNKIVEVVFYRSGSPSINEKTGIKPEKTDKMKEWFKLWVGKWYAYGYALKHLSLSNRDVFEVKSSYYFMKKSTDSGQKARDNDFFSGKGGNIVSLSDKYVFGAPYASTEIDDIFHKFIDECDAGFDCTDEDCKFCPGKANCKYTKAPVKLVKKSTKAKKAITPSEEQSAVIEAVKGIFKVNATAGSGKTECMTERTKRLICSGLNPKEILHISFTDAAVGEMKERIIGKCLKEGIELEANDIECYTFNAFANKAIGRFYKELGFTKAPAILSAEFELDIIEKLVNDNSISGIDAGAVTYIGGASGHPIENMILTASKTFNLIKTHRIDVDDPDSYDDMVDILREAGLYSTMQPQSVTELMDMYKDYNRILIEDNFVTYADQEPLMFKVLDLHPEYFENLGYKHIVVDEFQDSNEIQMETIKKLVNTKSFESLMVVGDDSQAIYSFRDTTPEFIINFDKYIGMPVTDLFLSQNRRSTPEIVTFANAINNLNENKVDKDMIATRDSGDKVVVKGFYNKKEEYEYIVNGITKKIEEGVKPNDIAFIASKKTELQEIGTLLTNAGIPWVMKNPMDLMENSRVLGALSIADAFYQPEATVLYFNYLAAKYDGELLNMFTIAEINDMIQDMRAQFETIYLLEMDEQRAIFHKYLDDIQAATEDELYDYFLSLIYQNEDLPSELEYTRIFKKYGTKMNKKMDQSYEGVVLTTAHSSKGLEWPVVYCSITNFDSESLHKTRNSALVEEKRRLLFVSATRARDELYMTGQYVAYGPKDDRTYNQFLHELYNITGDEYVPVDPMEAIRDAERKEKQRAKARERYAAKKMEDIDKLCSKSRSLTADEKKQYDKMAAGSKQMTLAL